MTGVLIRRDRFGDRETQGEGTPSDNGSGDWGDAATSQGMPRISGYLQKLRRKHGPADILISNFETSEL